MNTVALELLSKCYNTKDLYLDLRRPGLTDEDFVEGGALHEALRKCTQVQKLVLSNVWEEWNKAKYRFVKKERPNNSGEIFFATFLPALLKLIKFNSLFCEPLTALQTPNISNNQDAEIKRLDRLRNLEVLDF